MEEAPKTIKTIAIIKWSEAFDDFFRRVIGTRTDPLSRAIRDDDFPSGVITPLAPNALHPEDHRLEEDEMDARAPRDHPFIKDDNAKSCCYLEESIRSTQHAASIKPYHRERMEGVLGCL